MDTSQKVILAGAITVVLWASGFVGIEIALESYSPAHIALLRFLIASIVLFLVSIARPFKLPEKSDYGRVFLMGLSGIALYNICLNFGKQFVSSGTASFIVNTVPIFTVIFSAAILKERVIITQLYGTAIAFVGVGIIAIGEGHVVMPASWVLLLAPICQSLFFVLQKPLSKRYTAFELSCFSVWLGTMCMVPLGYDVLPAFLRASASANWGIVYLGLFPSILGYLCWGYVVANMSLSQAATFLYMIPVATISNAHFLRDDVVGMSSVLGGCLVIAGVITVRRSVPGKQ